MRTYRPDAKAPITVRKARAVRPPRPRTLPRSSGCTRTSRALPRRSARLRTRTSSGYWTIPRTRCSRASSSTSGLSPRARGRPGGLGGGRFGGRRFGGRRLSRGCFGGGSVLGLGRLGGRRFGGGCLGGRRFGGGSVLGLGRRGGGCL